MLRKLSEKTLGIWLLVGLLAGIETEVWAQGAPPAPAVTVASPLAQKVRRWDEYTGRFEAIEQVEIRARVNGYLESTHFKDGQMVDKGDLLFTIDPKPFQLAVDAAKAELARARANAGLAGSEFTRAENLVQSNSTSRSNFDVRKTTFTTSRAAVLAAEAALKSAELNLDWAYVRSPIKGRISDARVDTGALLAGAQNGATLLTTVVSVSPIHFVFEASEADYLRYARLNVAGARPSSRDTDNPVEVKLADEPTFAHKGKMDFVDNQLNNKTGTIRGRAIFENADGFLTPGMFGRLRLWAGDYEGMLIPDAAILSDQTRKIVLVVNKDQVVEPRIVELGPIEQGLRVIAKGLEPADQVIIQGLANPFVRPGVKVVPQSGEIKVAAAPASVPAQKEQ